MGLVNCACCLISSDARATFTFAKWFYFAVFVVSAVLTWVFRDHGSEFFDRLPEMNACEELESENESVCIGKGAVLRISFATFAFHVLHAIVLLGCKYEQDPRTYVHTGLLGLKLSGWVGLVVGAFFIPNSFFGVYGEIARVFSGFFLIFQAIVLLDLVYRVNEHLIDKDNCMPTLVAGSAFLYVLSLVMIGLAYHFYSPRASCSTNVGWITWTLIMALAYTALSISPWRIDRAGLLTSGAVFTYTSFLLLSALTSEPTNDNPCVTSGGMGDTWVQIVAFIIALGAVTMSTLSTGTSDVLESGSGGDALPYRPDFFHLIFGLAAMYLAMLFTNWSLDATPDEWVIDKGWQSAWVKIASQWLVALLYVWTLIAPKLLPDREFSFA